MCKQIAIAFLLLWSLSAAAQQASVSLEPDTNRPGMDYRNLYLEEAQPELCRKACERDEKCHAYTYVKPGIQGPKARCWLKSGAPHAQQAKCCVSGVKTIGAETRKSPTRMKTRTGTIQVPQKPPSDVSASMKQKQTPAGVLANVQLVEQFKIGAGQKLEHLRSALREESSLRKRGRPQKAEGLELRDCTTPGISSVSPFPTIRPGDMLYVDGCGFSKNTEIILYDPKGANDAFHAPLNLIVRKRESTKIQAEIHRVMQGALHPFVKPLSVAIRAHDWSKPKNPYSNSIQLTLEPNLDIYKLHGISSYFENGPSWLCGSMQTEQEGSHMVFHYPKAYPPSGTQTCKGTDVIVPGGPLREGLTFEGLYFSSMVMKNALGTWEGSSPFDTQEVLATVVEKNLHTMKGNAFLPKIQVEWIAPPHENMDMAVVYYWAVFVRAPEGFASMSLY